MEGDWVLVYGSSLDIQHSTARKFSQWWLGPYVVKNAQDNATYRLVELDGTPLAIPIFGKRIKVFKRRDRVEIEFEALDDSVPRIDDDED